MKSQSKPRLPDKALWTLLKANEGPHLPEKKKHTLLLANRNLTYIPAEQVSNFLHLRIKNSKQIKEITFEQRWYDDNVNGRISLQILKVFEKLFLNGEGTEYPILKAMCDELPEPKTLYVLSLACNECHEYPVLKAICDRLGIKLHFVGADICDAHNYYRHQEAIIGDFHLLKADCSNIMSLEGAMIQKNCLPPNGFDFVLLRHPEMLGKHISEFANMIGIVAPYFAKIKSFFYVSCYLKEELKVVRHYTARSGVYNHPVRYATPNNNLRHSIKHDFQSERYSIIYECKGQGLTPTPPRSIVTFKEPELELREKKDMVFEWASQKPQGRGGTVIRFLPDTKPLPKSLLREMGIFIETKRNLDDLISSLERQARKGYMGLWDLMMDAPSAVPKLFKILAENKEAFASFANLLPLKMAGYDTSLFMLIIRDNDMQKMLPSLWESFSNIPECVEQIISMMGSQLTHGKALNVSVLIEFAMFLSEQLPFLFNLYEKTGRGPEQMALTLKTKNSTDDYLLCDAIKYAPKTLNPLLTFATKTKEGLIIIKEMIAHLNPLLLKTLLENIDPVLQTSILSIEGVLQQNSLFIEQKTQTQDNPQNARAINLSAGSSS